jgi:hypothetical protein
MSPGKPDQEADRKEYDPREMPAAREVQGKHRSGDGPNRNHAESQRPKVARRRRRSSDKNGCEREPGDSGDVPGETERLLRELISAEQLRQLTAKQSSNDVPLSEHGVRDTEPDEECCGKV